MRLLLAILILLIPFAYAAYLFPDLPVQIPTHFGIDGKPDDWGSSSSIFAAPGILCGVGLGLFILFQNLSKFDPKMQQTPENAHIFRDLSYGLVGFLSILSIFIVHASANPGFRIDHYLLSFIGLSFAGFGKYMPKLQPNYFAGFRLPWTLEDPNNWKYTHQIAGTFWLYGGLLQALICSVSPAKWSIMFFLGSLFVIVIIPIYFSYTFYRKNKK